MEVLLWHHEKAKLGEYASYALTLPGFVQGYFVEKAI